MPDLRHDPGRAGAPADPLVLQGDAGRQRHLPRLPRLPGRDLDRRPRVASPAMPIYELEGVAPRIDADAFVHPDAVVIGDVTIGAESSVWPGAVLRGDYGTITVGARTSIQDGTVVHAGPGLPHRHRRRLRRRPPDPPRGVHARGRVAGRLRAASSSTGPSSAPGRRSAPTRWCPTTWWSRPARWRSGSRPRSCEGRSDVADDPGLGGRVRRQRQAVPGVAAPGGLTAPRV